MFDLVKVNLFSKLCVEIKCCWWVCVIVLGVFVEFEVKINVVSCLLENWLEIFLLLMDLFCLLGKFRWWVLSVVIFFLFSV